MKFVLSLLLLLGSDLPSDVRSITLVFSEGHFCLEFCEFGLQKGIKDKALGWVKPEYEVKERLPAGKVVVTLSAGSKLEPQKIAEVMLRNVTRVNLTEFQATMADGTVRRFAVKGGRVEELKNSPN